MTYHFPTGPQPLPVTTREINWWSLVQEYLGAEANKPEVVYEFSNGRQFRSTDATSSGVYSGD